MNKKFLISFITTLLFAGGVFLYWDEVLGMLGIGGASTLSLNKGLIAHYPMSQETLRSATNMGDVSSNGYHGTITPGTSAGFVADRHGQAAKAYDFDNANNGTKVNLNSSTMFNPYTDAFTISFWFRPDWSYNENLNHSFLQGGTGYYYASTPWFSIYKRENGNNNAFVMAWGTGQVNYRYASISNPTFFQSGQWVHIVWTKTGTNSVGTEALYANGVLQSLGAGTEGTISSAPTFSGNYYFGGDPSNSSGTDGRVSDLRIYKRALSTAEISLLAESYNPKLSTSSLEKGLVGHYPLSQEAQLFNGTDLLSGWDFTNWDTDAGPTNITATSFKTDANGAGLTKVILVVGRRYKMTIAGTIDGGTLNVSPAYSGTNYYSTSSSSFSATFTFTAITNTSLELFNNGSLATTTITSMTLQQEQTADRTPNLKHGTIYQDTTVFTTDRKAQANKAMEFNGTADYVNVGSTGQTVKSVSFWVYADNTSRDILDFDGGTHSVEVGSGTLTATGFATPTIYVDGSESATLTGSAWHHVVVTTATGFTASAFKIGKETTYFDGKLADVRLYDRVLSTSEITQLYESYNRKISTSSLSKGLIAYYPMKTKYYNATTTRMDDTTPSAYHGTFTAGSGSVGASYTTFGGNTKIDMGSEWIGTQALSISAWVYRTADTGRIIGNQKTELTLLAGLVRCTRNASQSVDSTASSVPNSTWVHVVCTTTGADPSTGIIYINGVQNATGSVAGTRAAGTENVHIGNIAGGTIGMTGFLSNLRVYNRVLTADEAALLYQLGR